MGRATSTTTMPRTAIRAEFSAAFARRDRDEWVDELAGADTCVAPVQSVAELADDPQLAHRGALVEAKHDDARAPSVRSGPCLRGWRRVE